MTTTPPSFAFRSRETASGPLWPTMLRASGLGLRPERVLVMLAATCLAWLIASVPLPWEGSRSLLELWNLGSIDISRWSWDRWLVIPSRAISFVSEHPWAALAVGAPALFVLLAAGAVVSRMAAVEVATGELVPAKRAFGLVSARLGSLAAVVLIPLGLVLAVLVAFAAVGAVLLSFAGVNIVGALLYGGAVLGSIALVLFVLACTAGGPMLAPAVVCEGTGGSEHGRGDAIDALQRAVAYVLAAPLRLAFFGAIGLAQVVVVHWIGSWVAASAAGLARQACTHWVSAESAGRLAATDEGAGLAASIMSFWDGVPAILAVACTLSVFASASTLLYLLIRRVCDGQHEREIWMPPAADAASPPASPLASPLAAPPEGSESAEDE